MKIIPGIRVSLTMAGLTDGQVEVLCVAAAGRETAAREAAITALRRLPELAELPDEVLVDVIGIVRAQQTARERLLSRNVVPDSRTAVRVCREFLDARMDAAQVAPASTGPREDDLF
jgi:propanediol dehydratase small subunit